MPLRQNAIRYKQKTEIFVVTRPQLAKKFVLVLNFYERANDG